MVICPRCKTGRLVQVSRSTLEEGGAEITREIFRCGSCNHQEIRSEEGKSKGTKRMDSPLKQILDEILTTNPHADAIGRPDPPGRGSP